MTTSLLIAQKFATKMPDVVLDGMQASIAALKRYSPDLHAGICDKGVDLEKVSVLSGHASDMLHLIDLPGCIFGVVAAKNRFEMTKNSLNLVRKCASIAKVIFDRQIISSSKGSQIAHHIKYGTWVCSGVINLGESLYKLFTMPHDKISARHGIQLVLVIKSISYLALGSVRLINRPTLNRVALPISGCLLISVSVWFVFDQIYPDQEKAA